MDPQIEHTFFGVILCPKGHVDYLRDQNSTALKDLIEHKRRMLEQEIYMRNVSGGDEPTSVHSNEENLSRQVEYVLNHIVVVVICVIGILGNLLNLAILSHRSWQIALGRMERFSHSGLIGLAASDLSFCLFILPHSFVDQHQSGYNSIGFSLVYNTYIEAIINTFVLCSTMLTVALAAGRYFAIVFPIRAREVIGMTFTRRVIGGVVLFSILANLPRYWFKAIRTIDCSDESNRYYFTKGPMSDYETVYISIYFVAAICLPLFVLIFCNVYLLKALKDAHKEAKFKCRTTTKTHDSGFRITLSLVIIIIAFVVLVIPGEVITFFKGILLGGDPSGTANPDRYNLPLAITSCMQALNFSFNFILYCSVNTHFRRTMGNMARCHWGPISERRRGRGLLRYDSASVGSNTNQVTLTMCNSTTKWNTVADRWQTVVDSDNSAEDV